MQEIISFLIKTLQSFIDTCISNELLSWGIFIFALGVVISVFSVFWRK